MCLSRTDSEWLRKNLNPGLTGFKVQVHVTATLFPSGWLS